MVSRMETDVVNEFKGICKKFLDGKGLTVHFDTAVSEEIKWRPHIFATDDQALILDILTQDRIPDFYIKKYIEISNALPETKIYVGLVGNLDYFPEVISDCHRNGFGVYKINNDLKLLLEARQRTIEDLSDRGQIAVVFGKPYTNILALKKCLRKCRSFLYWFERNLPKTAFETTFQAVDDGDLQNIDTVRFLRGIDDKISDSFRDEFRSFKAELVSHDIESQCRIICDSRIANRVHGRYIYTQDTEGESLSIKLPPLNSLKANQWDTILTDVSEIPSFQEFWDHGLDIEESWNEIKRKVNEYLQRRAQELSEQAETLRSRSTSSAT
jgi:hypothetical protein